ncbi:SH3 domain-containing protein [Myxococcus sp. Y35]|uniref:SH3 domain-containing protein n=1 Tax=Pseudomyxococcus flavus TaxID=3115648 RepID=UPI003CFB7BD3
MGMKTRAAWATAVLTLGIPAVASAVKVGEPLYVKAKNTRVLASPSGSDNAVAVLQPGEQVTWGGAHAKHKQWHRVTTATGKEGFVFQTNLSTTPPNMELVTDGGSQQRVDPKKFVASGAAVKALSPGAERYGKDKGGDHGQAVDDIKALETLAKGVSTEDIAAHVAAAGLFPVVGASAKVAATSTKSATKKRSGNR